MSDLEDLEGTFGEPHPTGLHRMWSEECLNGHAYDEQNSRLYKDKRGRIRRVCKACDRDRRAAKRREVHGC